jgi:hypothetical protein
VGIDDDLHQDAMFAILVTLWPLLRHNDAPVAKHAGGPRRRLNDSNGPLEHVQDPGPFCARSDGRQPTDCTYRQTATIRPGARDARRGGCPHCLAMLGSSMIVPRWMAMIARKGDADERQDGAK